jgi:hypothetical protein
MKFSYFQLGSGIRRPIIPLIVKANGKEVKYFALVDSGADLNLFHGEIAELLGIDLDSGAEGKISGITEGEAQKFFVHPVTVNVGGWDFETEVGFMPRLSRNGHGLLGQKGFFDLFNKVSFSKKNHVIELAPNK